MGSVGTKILNKKSLKKPLEALWAIDLRSVHILILTNNIISIKVILTYGFCGNKNIKVILT